MKYIPILPTSDHKLKGKDKLSIRTGKLNLFLLKYVCWVSWVLIIG